MRHVFLLLLCVPLTAAAFLQDEEIPWQEAQATLPAAPQEAALIEFSGGPHSENRFFVDGQSLQPGTDDVVRFTLVVQAPSGVRNVSFEGIRCATQERKLYAIGRPDGSWATPRNARWQPIAENQLNRHHVALAREFFCDTGIPIRTAQAGRDNLQRR